MGALLGLSFGAGLVLIGWWYIEPSVRPTRLPQSGWLRARLDEAGLYGLRPATFLAASGAAALAATAVVTLISGVWIIGIVFGLLGCLLPMTYVRSRARARAREHAELWPDAVDNLASAVRAGMSLTEALQQLSERGPEGLREPFAAFSRDFQSTGQFDAALDRLKARLAEPIGDRVVEAIRIARDVGGGDLGRMLRTQASYLRQDLRTRGELESRQAWTVNGARLATAAPWAVLLFMSWQRDVVSRFATGTGAIIVVSGALICVIAYRLMIRLGRLPAERRILA